MAIGPSLPPYLAKRKRDTDSDSDPEANDSGAEKRRKTVGPALPPPSLAGPNADEIEVGLDDSSDDDDAGPQPARPSIGHSLPAAPADEHAPSPRPRPVMGPSMPPVPASGDEEDRAGLRNGANSDDSDDSDDMGPAPPPAGGGSATTASGVAPGTTDMKDAVAKPARLQRDEWMLAPPTGGDWAAKVDPTKLRNRRFNQNARRAGGGPSTPSASGAAPADVWSETPEQKRRRLQNEVLGVSDASDGNAPTAAAAAVVATTQSRDDEERDRRVREYNEKHRGASLYSEHKKTRKREEEDDPSTRAFDREKDIAGGTKISFTQKREMMNRAADFGSRFSKGSYL